MLRSWTITEKEEHYGTETHTSRRTPERGAGRSWHARGRARPSTPRADEPHHGDFKRPPRHHRRHRFTPLSFLRHQRRILAQSAEPLRAAPGPEKGRQDDRPSPNPKKPRTSTVLNKH